MHFNTRSQPRCQKKQKKTQAPALPLTTIRPRHVRQQVRPEIRRVPVTLHVTQPPMANALNTVPISLPLYFQLLQYPVRHTHVNLRVPKPQRVESPQHGEHVVHVVLLCVRQVQLGGKEAHGGVRRTCTCKAGE